MATESHRTLATLRRYFPPVRVLWISLSAITAWGVFYLQGIGAYSLALPPLAATVDALFQKARFPSLRIPDGALVTGFLIALLLPPTAPILLTGTVVIVAISLKHVLRRVGAPIFNPAALGLLLGVLFLGLAPAWWVGLGEVGLVLLPVLGIVVAWRNLPRWPTLVTFFSAYASLSSLYLVFFQQIASPGVFLLTIFDPAILFFGFFMVTEPRTSPTNPSEQPVYGATVAIGSVFASLVFPSLGVIVALLSGNMVTAVLRKGSVTTTPTPNRRKRSLRIPPLERWEPSKRAGVGLIVIIMFSIVAAVAGPTSTPSPLLSTSGGGNTGTVSNCQYDNPAIPTTTLSELHRVLGPSVILSYNQGTGVTVFYDPVNHVTVTETDLYEDHGYAEFNEDDRAANGCVP